MLSTLINCIHRFLFGLCIVLLLIIVGFVASILHLAGVGMTCTALIENIDGKGHPEQARLTRNLDISAHNRVRAECQGLHRHPW